MISTMWLVAFFACSPRPAELPSTPAEQGASQGDTAAPGNGDTGLDPEGEQWPDGSTWESALTLVHDGVVVAPGDRLRFGTAPAGIDELALVTLTLTNRGEEALDLGTDETAWLEAPSFAWVDPPPSALDPEESASLTLSFDPSTLTEATEAEATLTVPGTDVSVSIVAVVPDPLRVVLVGSEGLSLVSTDYGATFTEHTPEEETEETTLALAWGDGVFLRAGREGGWSSDCTYAWSEDGETWTASEVAAGGWGFDCAHGDGRFVCVRDYGGYTTWSEDGRLLVHEANAGADTFLQAILWNGSAFVAVGRDGNLSVGDHEGLTLVEADDSLGDYQAIAQAPDGQIVAVGGDDNYVLSVSEDSGQTWSHQVWAEATYAALSSVAHNDGIWLAEGGNSGDWSLYRSFDGHTWEPLEDFGSWYGPNLLGSINGWFLGTDDDEILRSRDGESWEVVHTLSGDHAVVAMAAETWE